MPGDVASQCTFMFLDMSEGVSVFVCVMAYARCSPVGMCFVFSLYGDVFMFL